MSNSIQGEREIDRERERERQTQRERERDRERGRDTTKISGMYYVTTENSKVI